MNDFEKIYNDYFKLVYKYLLFLTNNADISEDLAQEIFYKAITKIHTFKNKSKISTWLCQIAKNLLLNEVRHNKKINIIPLSDNENLKNYLFASIKETTCNGIKCYRFTNLYNYQVGNNDYIYISKDNGLPIRCSVQSSDLYNEMREFSFEFDKLTEKDILELVDF